MKFKKPIAALCYDLINGKTVSIKTGFNAYGITNIPREISRAVEKRFGVKCEKKKIVYKSKYGLGGYYFEYKLLRNNQKKESLNLMYSYIQENMIMPESKNDKSGLSQKEMF